MTIPAIDDFVSEVARHLHLRGAARREALEDLRQALTETAATSSPAAAVAAAGTAEQYAANLDEEFGTIDDASGRFLGIPTAFGSGIGRRLAATFNPVDERLFVPRTLGAGWSLNMGAVAVRLGLLNQDDMDDDVVSEAADEHLSASRTAALAPVGLAVLSIAALWAGRRQAEQATGKSQAGNVFFGTVMPAVAAGLLVASDDKELPAATRLNMPATAATLGLLSAGGNLQLALRPRGQAIVIAAALAALPAQLLLSYLPVRRAIRLHQSSDLIQNGTGNE